MIISATPSSQAKRGPRPINPSKDIPQVIRLLEMTFGSSLDKNGQTTFAGTQANQPAFLWRLNPIANRLALGYVWEEEGQIIGNVTLLTTKTTGRYLVVNVAVHPDYRRQGIARNLMKYVKERVYQKKGKQILLQVEKENEAALQLYKNLNYTALDSMTSWYNAIPRIRVIEADEPAFVRKMKRQEWQAAFRLNQISLHPDLNWPELPKADMYQRGVLRSMNDFINGRRSETWVTTNGNKQLTGLSNIFSEWGRIHWASIRVHPMWRGQLERPLMAHLTQQLKYYPRRNVRIDHPDADELMTTLLKEANFQPRRTLTHMRLDL